MSGSFRCGSNAWKRDPIPVPPDRGEFCEGRTGVPHPRREQTAQARKAGIDYKIEDRTRPLVIPSGVAGPQVEQVSFF